VNTDELHVDVTGTKFNFRNYPEDEEATVSLLEGKVLVSSVMEFDDKKDLLPDQKVYLNKKTGELRIINVKAQYTTEWTNGYLFFDEELLTDIVRELERSYNVKFTLTDDSLENLRFYGNFVRGENKIEDILDVLASTDKIKYKIEGENIELSLK
jgi:ferric-dicitrate binding protein FerR (iron transport regulator)